MIRRRTLLALGVALLAAASLSAGPPVAAATPRGPVTVLYAGSLSGLMEHSLGPAFTSATGYVVNGTGAGSSALALQIKDEVVKGDVFMSAAPAVNATLAGPKNGSWVRWYAAFARSPLVLGYNPQSRFATALRTRPWYDVVTQPGFLLGRTDPTLDPKGALAVQAVDQTAAAHGLPALRALLASTSTVFPEEDLVGRLQAGQLDAGFFYASEAKAAGIPTVPLGTTHLYATYTVTVLRGAPNQAGARAFVAYLLGPKARPLLRQAGLEVLAPPRVTGAGVPASLARLLGR